MQATELIKGQFDPFTKNYSNLLCRSEYRNRTRNQLYDIEASGKLYFTGHYAGELFGLYKFENDHWKKNIGSLQLGFQNVEPHAFFYSRWICWYRSFRQSLTNFPVIQQGSFNKENITRIFAVVNIPPAAVQLMGEYYLFTNYTYFNGLYTSAQESTIFNVLHVAAQKTINVSKHLNGILRVIFSSDRQSAG